MVKTKLTFEDVQSEFGLEEADLKWLGLPASEPVPKRLFRRRDIKVMHEFKRYTLANASLEESVKELDKKCMAYIGEAAKPRVMPKLRHSRLSKLPLDVWTRILESLCNDLELHDARGPSVVARDICNASAVNKELYAASIPAFEHLSQLCPPISETIRDMTFGDGSEPPADAVWEEFCKNPMAVKLPLLKRCASAMCVYIGKIKSKPFLASGMLQSLHLRPTAHPARLVLKVCSEKRRSLTNKPFEQMYGRWESNGTHIAMLTVFETRKRMEIELQQKDQQEESL